MITCSPRSSMSVGTGRTSSIPAPVDGSELAAQLVGQADFGQLDHQLVDGHPAGALEHLQPDDVAADGGDAGGHGGQHARFVW